jgi:hypothetical protein
VGGLVDRKYSSGVVWMAEGLNALPSFSATDMAPPVMPSLRRSSVVGVNF